MPGKTLASIEGRSMLARVVERLRLCRTIDSIVIAAPEGPENEPLAEEARRLETPVWRGSQQDVLARYIGAAEAHDIDPVVRITADCPLLDPFLVDRIVGEYLRLRPQGVDLVCNTWPRRWPRGLDTEVLARSALERAHAVENDPAVREHVTLAIYQRTPPFRVAGLESERDLSGHRWTVDTQDDLAFMRGIYAALGDGNVEGRPFGLDDVLELLATRPELAALSAGVGEWGSSR